MFETRYHRNGTLVPVSDLSYNVFSLDLLRGIDLFVRVHLYPRSWTFLFLARPSLIDGSSARDVVYY